MKTEAGWEEGDMCNVDGCDGVLEFQPVKDCFCHISPPCGACVDNMPVCNECGREVEKDDDQHVMSFEEQLAANAAYAAVWAADRAAFEAHRRRREIAPGKFLTNIALDSNSGSTMVWTGGYEGPVTCEDIKEHFGDGTFGHRGPSMYCGRFTYTLITD